MRNFVNKVNDYLSLKQLENNPILFNWLRYSKEAVLVLSSELIVLEINGVAENLFREKREAIIGKNFLDQCVKIGLKFPLSIDPEQISPGQRIIDVETTSQDSHQIFRWTIIRTEENNHEPSLFIFIGQDMTQLKRVEALREKAEGYLSGANHELARFSQLVTGQSVNKMTLVDYAKNIYEYMDNIIANMPVSVYWLNRQGEYLGCSNNFAKLFNLKAREEIIGKTYKDLYDEKSGEFYRAIDAEVMDVGIAKTLEEPFYHIDGMQTWLSSKVPLRDSKGQVVGMLGTSINITERKRAEQALKEAKEAAEAANKAKTEFLENMRHDIRTPLSGIVGLAELLNSEDIDKAKIREFTTNLDKASKELLHFLNEVLESINVASGEIPLLKKKFNLRETLENVIKLHQPVAIEKGLTLALFIDEDIPKYLIGDSVRIYRIVLELIVNALKFTKKGHVSVFAKLGKKSGRKVVVKISVEDTGVGISSEKQQDLFVRFKRLTPSYEGIYKGAGLGLSIVKQFLEDVEGEIYVDSHLDEGTKFICVIPLKEPLLEEDPFKDTTPIENLKLVTEDNQGLKQNKKPTKRYGLVVEDQPIAALVEKTLLVEQGCEIDIVENGEAAIQQIQKNRYDFILMDIGLPDTDGYEVTKKIRLLEGDSKHKTFIIGLTGHADAEKKQLGLDAGMNIVLTKPLTQNIFVDLLENFIPNHLANS